LKLESVTLPDSIKSIGKEAFLDTKLYNDEVNWQSGALYIGRHLIRIKEVKSEDYAVKEGTLTIADSALLSCSGILSVSVPDGLKHIGDGSFAACTALMSITLPDSVESIGENAFTTSYYYLNKNNWKNGDLYIGRHLIETIPKGDGSVTIKNGTLTVAKNAFSYSSGLKKIVIPDSVVAISDGAFADCTQLETVCYSGNEAQKNKLTGGYADYCFETAVWEIAENNSAIFNNKSKADLGAWAIVLIVVAIIVFGTVFVLVADKKKK
jgi:hypothetical protein